MTLRLRRDEGCAAQPNLLWDSVWDAVRGCADWALQGFVAPANRGGLRAGSAIETAVTIQLFTDRRCPPDHPLAPLAGGDARGWWGDAVPLDAEDFPLGSLLWLLRNATVDEALRWAPAMAQDALAPIVRQGAAVRAEASAFARPDGDGIGLDVALYGRFGAKIYERRFESLWLELGAR